MTFRTEKFITRAMLRAEPETLFVFGDNVAEAGYGGQAKEMRGEPNAIGIPTKWYPAMTEAAFFKDADLAKVEGQIMAQFKLLAQHLVKGGDVVWPQEGIGTGFAQLQQRAPRILDLIEHMRALLEKLP